MCKAFQKIYETLENPGQRAQNALQSEIYAVYLLK